MAQPSGQVNLATAHAAEYFWYAQGSAGIWDARNGALLSKTGSAAMSTEGGVNVALGDGSTYYSLAASVTLTVPYTLRFRARKNSGQTTASMAGGNDADTNSFLWLDSGSGAPNFRLPWSDNGYVTVSGSAITTTALSTLSIAVDASRNYVIYQDDTNIGSGTIGSSTGSLQFIINKLLRGYTGGSFSLVGALEFVHLIPDTYTDATGIAALNADPYGVLDAGSTSDATFTITTADATFSGSGQVSPIASFALTASDATFAGAASSGSSDATFSVTTADGTFAGTATGDTSNGTLTTPALKNNTGTALANETGATAYVYNPTTGALVVAKTGQTTNASGVMTITDALIVAATQYRVVIVLGSGAEGMDKLTAA